MNKLMAEEMLGKGQTGDVLEFLMAYYKKEQKALGTNFANFSKEYYLNLDYERAIDAIIMQQASLSNVIGQETNGIADLNFTTMLKNRIKLATLAILNKLPESASLEIGVAIGQTNNPSSTFNYVQVFESIIYNTDSAYVFTLPKADSLDLAFQKVWEVAQKKMLFMSMISEIKRDKTVFKRNLGALVDLFYIISGKGNELYDLKEELDLKLNRLNAGRLGMDEFNEFCVAFIPRFEDNIKTVLAQVEINAHLNQNKQQSILERAKDISTTKASLMSTDWLNNILIPFIEELQKEEESQNPVAQDRINAYSYYLERLDLFSKGQLNTERLHDAIKNKIGKVNEMDLLTILPKLSEKYNKASLTVEL